MAHLMDERLGIIFARRSVRNYTSQKVTEEDLRSVLEAGMAAPSANNTKPWHFAVATDRGLLEELAETQPHGSMLRDAACAIAVCADPTLSSWWIQDCTAATQNVLVAAAGIGLGAVWLGTVNETAREDAVRKTLGIPDQIRIVSLISIGYPVEQPEPRTQYNQDRVHLNTW